MQHAKPVDFVAIFGAVLTFCLSLSFKYRRKEKSKTRPQPLLQMARFKRPKRYLLMDALPKNNYGKVLKTALRERLDTPAL